MWILTSDVEQRIPQSTAVRSIMVVCWIAATQHSNAPLECGPLYVGKTTYSDPNMANHSTKTGSYYSRGAVLS